MLRRSISSGIQLGLVSYLDASTVPTAPVIIVDLQEKIRRKVLAGQIVSKLFNGKQPKYDEFVKFVKDVNVVVIMPGDVPNKVVLPIHALCLQLLANGIIELAVGDKGSSLIGSDKLEHKQIVLKLGTDAKDMPLLFDDASWIGMTCV